MRRTPEATEERGTMKAKYPGLFGSVLIVIIMIVALCSFIPFLASFLNEERWKPTWGWGIYVLASFTLPWMLRILLPEKKGDWRERHYGWQEWSLLSYFFIIGLGLNWACAVLSFSRRYAFSSTPVIGVTGLIMAFYAAIALLVAWFESLFNNADLTGVNWRAALLVFVFAPVVVASVVLRLGLLR